MKAKSTDDADDSYFGVYEARIIKSISSLYLIIGKKVIRIQWVPCEYLYPEK